MSDDEHEMSSDKWVKAQSWSHVDLLEFLCLAFWALLVFMVIPHWWDNHGLTLATLNGQAFYMVPVLLKFFILYDFSDSLLP